MPEVIVEDKDSSDSDPDIEQARQLLQQEMRLMGDQPYEDQGQLTPDAKLEEGTIETCQKINVLLKQLNIRKLPDSDDSELSVAELINYLVCYGYVIENIPDALPLFHELFSKLGIKNLAIPLEQILSWRKNLPLQREDNWEETFQKVNLNQLRKLIYSVWDNDPELFESASKIKDHLEQEWSRVLLSMAKVHANTHTLMYAISTVTVKPEAVYFALFIKLSKRILNETPNYFPFFLDALDPPQLSKEQIPNLYAEILDQLHDPIQRSLFLRSVDLEFIHEYFLKSERPNMAYFFELPEDIQRHVYDAMQPESRDVLYSLRIEFEEKSAVKRGPFIKYLAGVRDPLELQLAQFFKTVHQMKPSEKELEALRNLLQGYLKQKVGNTTADKLTHNVTVLEFFNHDFLIPRLTKMIRQAYQHQHQQPEPMDEFLQFIKKEWQPHGNTAVQDYQAIKPVIIKEIQRQIESAFAAQQQNRRGTLLQRSINESAIAEIDRYLATNPAPHKIKFFSTLRCHSVHGAFNLELLQKELEDQRRTINLQTYKQSDLFQLFKSQSLGAARCMSALYTIATGHQLDQDQFQTMVLHGFLPDLDQTKNAAIRAENEVSKYFDLYSDPKVESLILEKIKAFRPNIFDDLQVSPAIKTLLQHITQILTPPAAAEQKNEPPAQHGPNPYAPAIIDRTIKKIMMAPLAPRTTLLEKELGAIYDTLRSKAVFEQSQLGQRHYHLRAFFEQYLLNKAHQQIEAEKRKDLSQRNYWFDTQKNLLLYVTFTPDDRLQFLQEAVKYQLIAETVLNKYNQNPTKQQFEALTSLQHTTSTLCSLSIHQDLQGDYCSWLSARAQKQDANAEAKECNFHSLRLFEDPSYLKEINSVPPLQTEAMMHLLLLLEASKKKLDSLYDEDIEQSLKPALLHAGNDIVAQIFAKSLQAAELEYSKSTKLDAADKQKDYFQTLIIKNIAVHRDELFTRCRKAFVNIIASYHPHGAKEMISTLLELDQHDYETTVACSLDYLDYDERTELVLRMTGTEYTAHDKGNKERGMGLRFYYYNRCSFSDSRKPYEVSPIYKLGGRVPSPANPVNSFEDEVPEVLLRLNTLYAEISTRAARAGGDVIEGLYTSLPTIDAVDGKNHQTFSAKLILTAMHQFNKKQLRVGNYLLVANMAVNFHSWPNPSPDTGFTVSAESATLFEMSILLSLADAVTLLPPKSRIKKARLLHVASLVRELYTQFLLSDDHVFFHQSEFGRRALSMMDAVKPSLLAEKNMVGGTTTNERCFSTLLNIYANNLHRNLRFGMLTQNLLIFLHHKTVGGCKSACERGPALDNRVVMLLELAQRPLPLTDNFHQEIMSRIIVCSAACTEAEIIELEKSLSANYNTRHLCGAHHIISCTCQGGPAKLNSSQNNDLSSRASFWNLRDYNTNIAFTSAVDRLPQNKKETEVKKFQAHSKDMAKAMKKLFQEKLDELSAPQHSDEAVPEGNSSCVLS